MGLRVIPTQRLVSALDDPIRFAALSRLLAGPATVSELTASIRAPQPKVSNHLAILREAALVTAARRGRHVVYAVASAEIAAVVAAIERASGSGPSAVAAPQIALARSCYDHIAGRLGVAIFGALVARDAIANVPSRPRSRKTRSGLGAVALGTAAHDVFAAYAIDLAAVAAKQRQFATACNDWTESRPHLGGALGAALHARLLESRWLLRRPGTRVLHVTPAGKRGFRERLDIDVECL